MNDLLRNKVIDAQEAEPLELDASPAPDLLAYIAPPRPDEPAQRLALASGRVVEAGADADGVDRVTIRGASGEVELSVRMTAEGPVLRFRAADLELESARDLRLRCDTFSVQARKGIVQETAGNLRQRVGGSADIKVRGELATLAGEVKLEAKRGAVQIEASDDVEIVGERVKLNC